MAEFDRSSIPGREGRDASHAAATGGSLDSGAAVPKASPLGGGGDVHVPRSGPASETVCFRVTGPQRALLGTIARYNGKTLSAWGRDTLKEETYRIVAEVGAENMKAELQARHEQMVAATAARLEETRQILDQFREPVEVVEQVDGGPEPVVGGSFDGSIDDLEAARDAGQNNQGLLRKGKSR